MQKFPQQVSVYKSLFEANLSLCGSRSIGKTIRDSLLFLSENIVTPDVQNRLLEMSDEDKKTFGPKIKCSVVFLASDVEHLRKIRGLFPTVSLNVIYRFAISEYLKKASNKDIPSETERNFLEDAFALSWYRKNILISWKQHALIKERYGVASAPAVVRTAIDFFSNGYEYLKPWAEPSTVTDADGTFFSNTTEGDFNRKSAVIITVSLFKKEQSDLEMLLQDFGLALNETIRLCLDRFLNLPDWKDRALLRDSSCSRTRLSQVEPSRQLSTFLSVEVEKDLKRISPNGKIQIPAREAILQYLAKSPYSEKEENNPSYSKGFSEPSGVELKKIGIHLIRSQFDKITTVATWENIPRSILLDRIFQDYVRSVDFL